MTPADGETFAQRISSRGSVPLAVEEPEIVPTPVDEIDRLADFVLPESPGPRLPRSRRRITCTPSSPMSYDGATPTIPTTPTGTAAETAVTPSPPQSAVVRYRSNYASVERQTLSRQRQLRLRLRLHLK